MIAVITADFIDSSNYSEELLGRVIAALKKEFKEVEKTSGNKSKNFKIYRGDSFQGIIENPEDALLTALQLKTTVVAIVTREKGKMREADLKLAIGIGTKDFEGESIEESNGQAFQFSGRSLDLMKNEFRKTRLKTPNENINGEFDASFYLLDTITDRWGPASAEVVYYLLKGWKESKIAEEIGISQSAVNQRKKAAGWDAIKALLDRYKNIISKTFSNE